MTETAPSILADQDVRERLLNELDRTFFVEAGAGTGKTTTLVGRIVNLVATGRVTMEHLAAITFTEAAAAELRDRVRERLERAAADPTRAEAQQAHCRRAVEEIDLAAISTIHAFAAGLLRTYPLEAGLPPAFATLDEIEQGLLFEERFKAWFWQEALEEPARSIVRRALLLGLTQGTAARAGGGSRGAARPAAPGYHLADTAGRSRPAGRARGRSATAGARCLDRLRR